MGRPCTADDRILTQPVLHGVRQVTAAAAASVTPAATYAPVSERSSSRHRFRWAALIAAPLAALALSVSGCSTSTTAPTATTTAATASGDAAPSATATITVFSIPSECLKALDDADALGKSYATYLGQTGKMFDAIARGDVAYVSENTAPLKTHMSEATGLAQTYATDRDACRANSESATAPTS